MSITLYELRDMEIEAGVVYVDVDDYGDEWVHFKQEDDCITVSRKDLRRLAEAVLNPDSVFSQ